MYFCKQAKFNCHDAIEGHFSFQPTCSIPMLPETAYPISVQEVDHGWTVSLYSSYCPTLSSLPPSSFSSFCSLLDDWESTLLFTVTFLYDPFNLASLLEMSKFKACSNGSAVAYVGTYGWVLSLDDGTRLAYSSGPVDGHDPRSFRAEGQGMLSILCFLRRLAQWTHATSPFTGTFATDNTGLIARIKSQRALKYPVPNATFKPDWDVVQAIVETMHSFFVEATFEHVRGHQDNKIPFSELPLLAKLNVEADCYAGTHRDLNGRHHPIISLSATRPVALDIDGHPRRHPCPSPLGGNANPVRLARRVP
jgi:hypothetical protein